MKTKREKWGGKYVNVTRDDSGRIKTWAKWSSKNKPADKSYNAAGFARRNYARGIADRLKVQEVTRGSVNKPKGELREYTLSVEMESAKTGKRSPARIKEVRLVTDDLLNENTLYDTIRELARKGDKNLARWIDRFDDLSGIGSDKANLRRVFNAGTTTSRVRGVTLK